MQYCIILIKYQCSSLPLFIDENVENQLYHLRIKGPLHQQLLKLDEFIQSCECQFKDQLFFIKNDKGKEFVVILSVKLGELKTCENLLPFMICPMLKIEGVTSEAIYYRDGWECNILWPKMSPKEKFDFAKWLHEKLMDISERYYLSPIVYK
uniref:Uncharacterized protein n=1 Tax=Panagrolaimus superbus TaxID=310955 RepID=A0A914XX94_9BILA